MLKFHEIARNSARKKRRKTLSTNEKRQPNGERIRSLRLARGWTIKELEKKSGLSDRSISEVENGGKLGRASIGKLAKALEVPVDVLYEADQNPPSERATSAVAIPNVIGLQNVIRQELEERELTVQKARNDESQSKFGCFAIGATVFFLIPSSALLGYTIGGWKSSLIVAAFTLFVYILTVTCTYCFALSVIQHGDKDFLLPIKDSPFVSILAFFGYLSPVAGVIVGYEWNGTLGGIEVGIFWPLTIWVALCAGGVMSQLLHNEDYEKYRLSCVQAFREKHDEEIKRVKEKYNEKVREIQKSYYPTQKSWYQEPGVPESTPEYYI